MWCPPCPTRASMDIGAENAEEEDDSDGRRITRPVFLEDGLEAVFKGESLPLANTLFCSLLRVFSEVPYLMNQPLCSSGSLLGGAGRASVTALALQDTPGDSAWTDKDCAC